MFKHLFICILFSDIVSESEHV